MSDFKWDEQLILEYARTVIIEYNNSKVWSQAFSSEENIMKRFKESKQPKPEWEILEGARDKPNTTHKWDETGVGSCERIGCKIHSVKRLSDGEVFVVSSILPTFQR